MLPCVTGQDQFDGIFEMYPTSIKKLYVVDGGLSFNSPYPLLLRPQRGVDLILSFDFSARATDTTPPFKVSPVQTRFWLKCFHINYRTIFNFLNLYALMIDPIHLIHIIHWYTQFTATWVLCLWKCAIEGINYPIYPNTFN